MSSKLPGHDQFFAFKTEMLDYLSTIVPKWPGSPDKDRFRELLDYTTEGGKCLRGLLSVYGFLELTGIDPNSDEAKPAYALGWAQEILQASFLVADDLMDKSELRRGRPCWYKREEKGYVAVSDSYFLENVMYALIDHYFQSYDAKTKRNLRMLLRETTVLTAIGQFIDMTPKEATVKNWELTVTNKTSYYSIWQPFVSGICASRKVPDEVWQNEDLKSILISAGRLFQCQDDWMDLYGDAAAMGKVGRDIQDGKVSWLFAKAMELSNDEQKQILKENVGHEEPERVERVKQVYASLDIDRICRETQDKMYEDVKEGLERVDSRVPRGLIQFLLRALNRRQI